MELDFFFASGIRESLRYATHPREIKVMPKEMLKQLEVRERKQLELDLLEEEEKLVERPKINFEKFGAIIRRLYKTKVEAKRLVLQKQLRKRSLTHRRSRTSPAHTGTLPSSTWTTVSGTSSSPRWSFRARSFRGENFINFLRDKRGGCKKILFSGEI